MVARSYWKREKVDCGLADLCRGTQAIAVDMLQKKVSKTLDEVTAARFKKASDFLLKNREFEMPPIAVRLPDGLSILDGNHRVTAFCGLQDTPDGFLEQYGLKKPKPEQDLWIGTHSRGEVPLDYDPTV